MPDSRRARIVLEVAFLAVVTTVLAVARVEPAWVVLVLLVSWALVALLEWIAWHDEPHWASGHPPRYYVPSRPVPPRPPTQELPRLSLYPRPPDDAPTWIAPPELREELLAEASAAAAVVAVEEEEWNGWPDGHLSEPEADPWGLEQEPLEVEPEPEPAPAPVAVEPEPVVEPVAPASPRPVVLSRHRIDPFAEPVARRRRRQRAEDAGVVELPSLPRHTRVPERNGR